jgi:hypothetical protein
MKRYLMAAVTAFVLALAFPSTAFAQSGHFISGGSGAPACVDTGIQLKCTGKVAGLGGTTFEITVEAEGRAKVVCHNPSGHRAPGHDTEVDVSGATGPLETPRNGQYRFSITTDTPDQLPSKVCPNKKWTPEIVDVVFGSATLSLYEDGTLSDQVVVKVS